MEQKIEQAYFEIAAKCGFKRLPKLIIEPLDKDQLGRYSWITIGSGFKTRTIDEAIHADPEGMAELDDDQITAILAHEFAHWICHWVCISGGDATADGQNHGARFLSVWLWIWKKLGKEGAALEAEAIWHTQAYNLSVPEMKRALKAATAAETAADAISLARPPTDRKAEMLFWLRFGAWSALAGSGMALLWQSPISATISVAMCMACTALIYKIKGNKQPIFAGA